MCVSLFLYCPTGLDTQGTECSIQKKKKIPCSLHPHVASPKPVTPTETTKSAKFNQIKSYDVQMKLN